MHYHTVIAFDFGTYCIGTAIGQNITKTANPLAAFKAKNGVPDWQKVGKLLADWQPDLIIVGLPLNMDGSEQPLTQQARQFANRLQGRFGIKVLLHDERLTTIEAKSNLFDRGGFAALNKSDVDTTSAVIILESWFNQQ